MKAVYIQENQAIKKIYKLQTLELILFSIIILQTVMPIVGRVISNFLTTYFLLLVVGFIYLLSIRWKQGNWVFSVISLIGIEIINAISTMMEGGSITTTLYGSLLSFCPIIIALIFQKLVEHEQRQLTRIAVFAFVVTFITTLVGVIRSPMAARYLATVAFADEIRNVNYEWENIGGFSFVYMLVVLYPLVISYMKLRHKPFWMCVTVTAILLIFFLKVEYGTALILFSVLSIMWILPPNIDFKKVLMIMGGFTIIVMILRYAVGELFEKIALAINSSTLQERSQYIADVLRGINSNSDAGLRSKVLLKSMNSFLNHPILGTWYLSGQYVGGHSYILDFIAKYGLAGLALLMSSYLQIYRCFYKKNRNTILFTPAICAFLVAITLSIVNTGNHWFELALIVPMFFNERIKKNQQEGSQHEDFMDSKLTVK